MEKIKVYVVMGGDNDGVDQDEDGAPFDKAGMIEGIFFDIEKANAYTSQLNTHNTMKGQLIYWTETQQIDG